MENVSRIIVNIKTCKYIQDCFIRIGFRNIVEGKRNEKLPIIAPFVSFI